MITKAWLESDMKTLTIASKVYKDHGFIKE
jgi:hypothetical protein